MTALALSCFALGVAIGSGLVQVALARRRARSDAEAVLRYYELTDALSRPMPRDGRPAVVAAVEDFPEPHEVGYGRWPS